MPVFIPDLIPDTNVENTPRLGWSLGTHTYIDGVGFAHAIYDPQGRRYDFSWMDVIRACSVARMSEGAFLDRLCIGQDGNKLFPLVEGTPLYDIAVANTPLMKNPMSMAELVPGMLYISDKNEKFLWLGEVHIRNLFVRDGKITPIDTKEYVRLKVKGNRKPLAQVTKNIRVVKSIGQGEIPAWPTIVMDGSKNSISCAIVSDTPFPAPTLHCDFATQHSRHFHDGEYFYYRWWSGDHWKCCRIHDDLTVEKCEDQSRQKMSNVLLTVKSGEWTQGISKIE